MKIKKLVSGRVSVEFRYRIKGNINAGRMFGDWYSYGSDGSSRHTLTGKILDQQFR